MREATYDDAVTIAKLTRSDQDTIWKLIKGVRFSSIGDLARLIVSLNASPLSRDEAATPTAKF